MATRRHANEQALSRRYANKSLILAFFIPVVLIPWSIAEAFTDTCANICSYSEYTLLADIVKYVCLAIAGLLTLWMAHSISWGYEYKENRGRIIVAFIIASFFSIVLFSGIVSYAVEYILVRMMY